MTQTPSVTGKDKNRNLESQIKQNENKPQKNGAEITFEIKMIVLSI